MDISVFGLGYVGTVASACLAAQGHKVIGIDPNQTKVDLINRGQSPIVEAKIGEIIKETVAAGSLKAVTTARESILSTDLSIVCVGTPSARNGSLELDYVRAVCKEIGDQLRTKPTYHVVVIRSTILPGTMTEVVIPSLERSSGKQAGKDFGVCHNPEFLREGSAVNDYHHPPKTVIGEIDERSGAMLEQIYTDIKAPMFRVPIAVAEMVKYSDNVWHAVKVCFANEIGSISKAVGVDSHQVMDIFCQDTKLNLSSNYLRPGFAFGGSCLPKDIRALAYKAQDLDLTLPLLTSILHSNEKQIERGLDMIMDQGSRNIGVLGFSFKEGTDDLRESPLVEIIERLLGKGYQVKIFDENVNVAKLFGSNREFILEQIPHISNLMVESVQEVLDHADTLVLGNGSVRSMDLVGHLQADVAVVDLVRLADLEREVAQYDGICW